MFIIRVKIFSELGKSLEITNSNWLLVTAEVFPSSLIFSAGIMKTILSSETSILKRTTRYHIPENGILETKAVTYFQSTSLMLQENTQFCLFPTIGLIFTGTELIISRNFIISIDLIAKKCVRDAENKGTPFDPGCHSVNARVDMR
jgi:hypothetical protein